MPDVDLRVATMQPRLSATGFKGWYTTLQGGNRQVGSIGSAVVAGNGCPTGHIRVAP